MLKEKLNQLQTVLNNLKDKLTNFKTQQAQALKQLQTNLNVANNKLELSLKENSENEKVLEQLIKEMGELEKEL